MEKPTISAVIPVYNEASSLHELHNRLKAGLSATNEPWEIIYVDDGSNDGSTAILREFTIEPEVTLVRLTRNFGQHPAIAAGVDRMRGEWIVTMDADLQNDPAEIPRLWQAALEGHDLVNGARVERREKFSRRRASSIANWLMRRLTGVPLRDFSSGFKLCHRSNLTNLADYGEMRRFLGILVARRAKNPTEVEVSHYPRKSGKSKYGLFSLMYFFMEFIVSYKPRTFQIVGISGSILFGLGLIGAAVYAVLRWAGCLEPESALQVLIGMMIFFGVQITFFGFLGEFIQRIYMLSQGVPFSRVESVTGPAHLPGDPMATPDPRA
jgi:glycosyltransferase involved in cell wall biosynthesis